MFRAIYAPAVRLMGELHSNAVRIAAGTVVLALISACGAQETPPIEVSRAAFEAEGKVWPLTVDLGFVGCTQHPEDPRAEMRWFMTPDGKRYSLNGFATKELGFADIEPIWREDDVLNRQLRAALPEKSSSIRNRISLAGLSEQASMACP